MPVVGLLLVVHKGFHGGNKAFLRLVGEPNLVAKEMAEVGGWSVMAGAPTKKKARNGRTTYVSGRHTALIRLDIERAVFKV
jgi:hypothetical protein